MYILKELPWFYYLVWVERFELSTTWFQIKDSDQTELHPDI